MIVQACLNGRRTKAFHPAVPISPEEIARDAVRAVEAGAAELHIHARNHAGEECLRSVDEVVSVARSACPGTPIGVSTGSWIETDPQATLEAVSAWQILPDYASVNLSEAAAPALFELLGSKGIGIEAGIASVEDAERFVSRREQNRVVRILIEMDHETEWQEASDAYRGITDVLGRAPRTFPVLLHGYDATVWPFVRLAREKRLSTRVGFEDGKLLPSGQVARDNAELVAAAVAIFGSRRRPGAGSGMR